MSRRENILVVIVIVISFIAVSVDWMIRIKQPAYKGKYIGANAAIMKRLDSK